jgi:hypothetical protein
MKRLLWLLAVLSVVWVSRPAWSQNYSGQVSLGYVWTDEEGDLSLNQPTFNTYEGVALSLRQFRFNLKDGMYVFGDLKNMTLNNRNLRAGVSKPGLFYVALDSRQYRRIYSADGGQATQRAVSGGNAWIQPHRLIRLFGGYSQTNRRGSSVELYELAGPPLPRAVDFKNQFYNVGVVVGERLRSLELEYKGQSYTDQLGVADQYKTVRYRASGRSAVPRYENLWVNAGYELYQRHRQTLGDSIETNLGWGGLRLNLKQGWTFRYSFVWDRTRATSEPVATDNIVNSVAAEKTFPGKGGLSVGYRYLLKDDIFFELKGNSFFASGWFKPDPRVDLRADVGTTSMDDKQANTLTGDNEVTRYRLSATLNDKPGKLRLKYESRQQKYDDIGSSMDYDRFGADLTLRREAYGSLTVSYSYILGEYADAYSTFEVDDNVLDGLIETARWHGVQALFGGTYLRSKRDLDTERFSVKAGGRFTFARRYTLEAIYTAHNFDDFIDANNPGLYTRYYTANIVEVNLISELGIQ